MSSKNIVMLGLFIGSTIGGYIPVLFGQSFISPLAIIGSTIGGIIGIYIAYQIAKESF